MEIAVSATMSTISKEVYAILNDNMVHWNIHGALSGSNETLKRLKEDIKGTDGEKNVTALINQKDIRGKAKADVEKSKCVVCVADETSVKELNSLVEKLKTDFNMKYLKMIAYMSGTVAIYMERNNHE